MKKINIEALFLNERLLKIISIISVLCGIASLICLGFSHEVELLVVFEKTIKILVTILTLWAFTKYHWDAMQGMIGGVLFALLYQEAFLVLGKLWGETSDFDTFLIMGVQGSLYLAAQSMSFLMTVIIVVNHFVINYSRFGNLGNVIFNQISIVFKILLYIFLMIINVFLKQKMVVQMASGLEYVSDLCIVIMIICIETQLDNFKTLKQELLKAKKEGKKKHE